jgi:hypothetical protein
MKKTLTQFIRDTREITAGLNITRDQIRQQLIEKEINPTQKRIDEIIRIIRLDAMNAANNSLVDYMEHN